jgi:hypothetical protein
MLFSKGGCTQGFNTFNRGKPGVLNPSARISQPFTTRPVTVIPIPLSIPLFFLGKLLSESPALPFPSAGENHIKTGVSKS